MMMMFIGYYRLLGTVPETDVLVVTHKRNM